MTAFYQINLLCLKEGLTLQSFKVSSSPNSPVLFAIVFRGEAKRTSYSQMFLKIDILKNFVSFTGKH